MKQLRKISYLILALILCASVFMFTACGKDDKKDSTEPGSSKNFESMTETEKVDLAQNLIGDLKFDGAKNWELAGNFKASINRVLYGYDEWGNIISADFGGVDQTQGSVSALFNLKNLTSLKDANLNSIKDMKLDLGILVTTNGKTATDGKIYVRGTDSTLDMYVNDGYGSQEVMKQSMTISQIIESVVPTQKPTDPSTGSTSSVDTAKIQSATEALLNFITDKKIVTDFIIEKAVTVTKNGDVVAIKLDYAKFINTILDDVTAVINTVEANKTTINDLVNNATVKAYIDSLAGNATAKEIYDAVVTFAGAIDPTAVAQIEQTVSVVGAPVAGESVYDYVKKVLNAEVQPGVKLGDQIVAPTAADLASMKEMLPMLKQVYGGYVCNYTVKVKNGTFAGAECKLAINMPVQELPGRTDVVEVELSIAESSKSFVDVSTLNVISNPNDASAPAQASDSAIVIG